MEINTPNQCSQMPNVSEPYESSDIIPSIRKPRAVAKQVQTDEQCHYCGMPANFYFTSTKKYCCSSLHTKCPAKRQENAENPNVVFKGIPVVTDELCAYCRKQVGKFRVKSGKVCCMENPYKCRNNKKLLRELTDHTPKIKTIKTEQLCEFGCGQLSKFEYQSGKRCCSRNVSKCPKYKDSEDYVCKVRKIAEKVDTDKLCSFCEMPAHYYFTKKDKYCCSSHHMKCPAKRKEFSDNPNVVVRGAPVETEELCVYNCGQTAKFQFKNGKYCCSPELGGCPTHQKIRSDTGKNRDYTTPQEVERLRKLGQLGKGKPLSEETKKKLSIANTGKKKSPEERAKMSERTSGKNNPNFGKTHSPETRKKISKANKGKILSTNSRRKLIEINKKAGKFYDFRYSNYNIESIPIIKAYGRKHGFHFRHGATRNAEGELLGEFWIKNLDYYVDAIDFRNKKILEIDEPSHYVKGELTPADVQRQADIMKYYPDFEFIRLKLTRKQCLKLKGRSNYRILP